MQFDFPDENGKPYKTSGGKMVYNETLKREIPQGWEVKKLGDVLDIGSGYPFNSDSYIENGKYSVITIKNVQEMYLDLSKTDKINYIPDNIKDFCVLNIGDILISLTGNVGRMCFVDRENLFLNQRVGKFICSKKYLYYIYLLFNREETQNRLSKLANGSSQSNLSPIEVVKDAFIDPSAFVLKNFNDKINLLYGKIIQNQQQIQHLQKLRDTLLPMLMNGQIEVE